MKIDQERFYWACRKEGIANLAEKLGLSPSSIQRKLRDPQAHLYVDELFTICEILNPKVCVLDTIKHYALN